MALSADRDTPEAQHPVSMIHQLPTASSTQFYAGGMLVLDQADGLVKKASTATGLIAIGRCEENLLTGSGNTRKVKAKSGVFRWGNSAAADAIAADDIGKDCYIVDDETVALTSNSSARSKAGTIYDVDSTGVWVHTEFPKP